MYFAELIRDKKIVIPKIQRDYAHGRAKYNKSGLEITSEKPYQIRTGLVKTLYDGIDTRNRKDLNFVYGKNTQVDGEEVFIPIDGQQRLTTLFLLHWYVYQRANQLDEIKKLCDKFSYETRDTTKNFCHELCGKIILSDADDVRLQKLLAEKDEKKKAYRLSTIISDKIWYTSSYANDPSVKSMLKMLDTIEEKFATSGKYKCVADFENISELLKGNDCPITFSYLDVNDFDDEDMYIKMNARGKELTDFEIFKAKLEEGDTLKGVCYSATDDQSEKATKLAAFMGKYNNEFTNLFYSINEIGKKSYDLAFFQFIECFIKYDHYAQLIGYTGIKETYYYSDFSNTIYTGASLFSDYILNPVLHDYKGEDGSLFVEPLRARAKESLNKITGILEFFYSCGFNDLPEYKNNLSTNNTTYDEKKLFIKNSESKKNNIDLVTQYALFSYLYYFNCVEDFKSQSDAYREWKRFVCNITYNLALKDPVNFAKMVAIFDAILQEIKHNCTANGKKPCIKDILTTIRDYNDIQAIRNIPMEVIRHLYKNEAQKADLMLDETYGEEWRTVILEAEEYFYDGDISILFEIIGENGTPEDFKVAFDKIIKWIRKDKTPQNESLFNEALLSISYPLEKAKTAHLKIYSYGTTWQIYCGKQANLRDALSCKLSGKDDNAHYGILQLIRNYDLKETPEEYAEKLIVNYQEIPDCWLRNTLIKERIVQKLLLHKNKWDFSGTIGLLSQNSQNEYVLFSATAYNSWNLELNTFRLAINLIETHPDLSLTYISGKTRGRTSRYVELNGKKVGYDVDCHTFYNIDNQTYFTKADNDLGMGEAIEYLTSTND